MTASANRAAKVWDAATGECLLPLAGHKKCVCSAAFLPDGTLVVTAAEAAG